MRVKKTKRSMALRLAILAVILPLAECAPLGAPGQSSYSQGPESSQSNQESAWQRAGFTNPDGVNSWINAGVTNPTDAQAWIAVDTDQDSASRASINGPPGQLSFFIQNGATPAQVKPFMDIIVANNPGDTSYWYDIEQAWPYFQKGYSPADSLSYSAQNIPVDQVPQYQAQQQQQQQQVSAQASQTLNIVNSKCGGVLYNDPGNLSAHDQGVMAILATGGVSNSYAPLEALNLTNIQTNSTDITQFSPYGAKGKCFYEHIVITQWNGQNAALVNDSAFYVDFSTPPQTNETSVIILGEDPFTYTSVSGAQQTVARGVVLEDFGN